ncbi:MAG: TolC family protein [Alistipes sp.]
MKRLILTVCIGLTTLLSASAQMQLTLDEAVQLALNENPTIRIANLEIQRYDYVRRETWGNWIPQIGVSGTYSRSVVKQEMAKGISFGADNTLTAQADATWALFAPSIYQTLKLNKVQLANAVESARASRITLITDVKKAFYNILLTEQSLDVLRESEATVQRTVNDTKLQYENGLTSEYDLLTAQVQLSNLRPTIIKTENSIKVAKLMLKMYLSIPEDITVDIIGKLDDLRDAVLTGVDALTTDLTDNTSLRALDLQKQLLQRQLQLSNASRIPTVIAFMNATLTGNDMDMSKFGILGGGSTSLNSANGSNFWWQHPVSAGLKLSIPIFSGLTKMNRARQIRNQITQVSLQRDYAQQQIDVQVRSSINDLMTAREMMFAQELTVEQAEKAYAIAYTRYRAGAGTILELNSSQINMVQAQLSYSQSIYNYISAKAEYDKIIGKEE